LPERLSHTTLKCFGDYPGHERVGRITVKRMDVEERVERRLVFRLRRRE